MATNTSALPVLNEGVNSVKAKALWALADRETGEIALTQRGLLATYTSREGARAAKAAGRIRVQNPKIVRFSA